MDQDKRSVGACSHSHLTAPSFSIERALRAHSSYQTGSHQDSVTEGSQSREQKTRPA
jgi:hypothetical protein